MLLSHWKLHSCSFQRQCFPRLIIVSLDSINFSRCTARGPRLRISHSFSASYVCLTSLLMCMKRGRNTALMTLTKAIPAGSPTAALLLGWIGDLLPVDTFGALDILLEHGSLLILERTNLMDRVKVPARVLFSDMVKWLVILSLKVDS